MVDFSEAEKSTNIGYSILEGGGLKPVNFEAFIRPYLQEANSHQQVYKNLRGDLVEKNGLVDSVIKEGVNVSSVDIATAALGREAIINSMKILIEQYNIELPDASGLISLW